MKQVSVFLADGFEEIEGLTVVDILRRADVGVDTVSITGDKTVHGAHQIDVQADFLFEEMDFSETEMLVLPGGMPGTTNLMNHEGLMELLKAHREKRKYLAAICAAPSIFGKLGFLNGRKACCYPTVEEQLEGALVLQDTVTVDGHIVTSRGMGTAIPFALMLVALLCGEGKAGEIRQSIVY